MNKVNPIKNIAYFLTAAIVVSTVILLFISSDCNHDSSYVSTNEAYHLPPALPDSLTFCGEKVPLEYFDVKEALEREMLVNSFYHSQTILLIKRANRFFPEIESILKAQGIPDDFKYLAVAESGLENVVSPKKAVGFWQILEGTAKDYGLEINEEVDERYHIAKSTEVACKYLNESYAKFGSWTLTAASYNGGRLGIDRQITRQKENNYYNLLFGEETARYVYRILALKLILSNPAEYNFHIAADELYQPYRYKEEIVNSPIESWADFANEHKTNYKMLKYLNPWLRDDKLANASGKEYQIRIPNNRTREE